MPYLERASYEQKQIIYSLVHELSIKKCSIEHKDIYEEYMDDSEFWNNVTDRIISNFTNSSDYCDGFRIIAGVGGSLELCDKCSKTKYVIYKDGSTEGPLEYTPSGGCYVATCVYGSYDCPPVWTLRRFRDNILSNSVLGRLFIKVYYATSPTAVRLFGNQKWFHALFKAPLDKLVKKLQQSGVESTPYND